MWYSKQIWVVLTLVPDDRVDAQRTRDVSAIDGVVIVDRRSKQGATVRTLFYRTLTSLCDENKL